MAIRRHILDDPTIVTLIQDRVEPSPPAQASALPVITFDPISLIAGFTLDGTVGPDRMRLQFDCWAQDYRACAELGKALKDRLHCHRGLAGGEFIDSIFCSNQRGPRFENEAKVYRLTSEFIVHAAAA